MARMEDLPEGEREMLRKIGLPMFETTPFVPGKPLSKRRVAILKPPTQTLTKARTTTPPQGDRR